ncbi:hypothetical protein OROHE_005995 [Orobanche hederae]
MAGSRLGDDSKGFPSDFDPCYMAAVAGNRRSVATSTTGSAAATSNDRRSDGISSASGFYFGSYDRNIDCLNLEIGFTFGPKKVVKVSGQALKINMELKHNKDKHEEVMKYLRYRMKVRCQNLNGTRADVKWKSIKAGLSSLLIVLNVKRSKMFLS